MLCESPLFCIYLIGFVHTPRQMEDEVVVLDTSLISLFPAE